ncbi:MAG: hypothetical protein HQL80_12525 [Magnetococcales bacterium]|nr:hypothetical protein [Magnetococcales bacterium]
MASSLPGGSSLPSQGKPAVASQNKSTGKSAPEVDEGKIEELSFGEIRELEKELAEQQKAKTQQELEAVRKKKEEDELSGKKKEVQKVSISEVKSSAKASKRGGLPEHIAALPKDHPIRQRWEKGFRQRPDGSWVKAAPPMDTGRTLEEWAKFLGLWLAVILLLVSIARGTKVYRDTLQQKREEVVDIITKKGLALDDPEIKATYMEAITTSWLPTLEKLLEAIRRVPRKFDMFPSNPEQGSYMEYIQRHGKQFDEREALEWQTRSLRRPVE